jgi:hypothetical protein
MTAPGGRPAARKGVPTWVFVVVPMLLAGALVGGVAIAVRSSSDDGTAGPDVSGPALGLPAVTGAAQELLDHQPAPAAIAAELGAAYGAVTVGLASVTDEVQFAERFERLPDAEAKLLGRTLGAIQAQLTPKATGGPREPTDRSGDILFALALARSTIQAAEPDASARDQALAVLPFSVQDLQGFDSLAATFASGDMAALAPKIDGALSESGAAEIVSTIAYFVGQQLPAGGTLATTFDTAYQAELP